MSNYFNGIKIKEKKENNLHILFICGHWKMNTIAMNCTTVYSKLE